MKLVLELDEKLAKWLEEKSKKEGKQVESIVIEALKRQLEQSRKKEALKRFKNLPAYDLGGREITREYIYEDRC